MKSKAINYLRCIAALLVINTHLTGMYPPKLSFLAAGGFFANSLFFFVSGYCLTNVELFFPKWYWKRFLRVYVPYLLMIPILFLAGSLAGLNWINVVMPFEAYHFIPTILLLYIFYYFLTKLNQKTKFRYEFQIVALLLAAILWFVFFFDKENGDVLRHFSVIESIFYLIPMLLGGMAKEGRRIQRKWISLVLVVVSLGLYAFQSFRPFTGWLKILQPMIGLLFAYGLGCLALSLENKLPSLRAVDFVASVTLECYLVQMISLHAFLNTPFPVNILYHVICSLAAAWCLHWVADKIVKLLTKKIR